MEVPINNKRRELLKQASSLLSRASDYVSQALDGEQDCLDNMPENLQYGEKCEKNGGCNRESWERH